MNLCCGTCATWTVEITGKETWTSPRGGAREFAAGRCTTCGSLILIDPTLAAVEKMAAMCRAAKHVEKAMSSAG